MRQIKLILGFMLCGLLPVTGATGAPASAGFEMPGSYAHEFSSAVIGDSFSIVVSLPFGYDRTERAFPLLFALDGDGMFGMESDIPRLLSFEGKVPPMIVASVVYGDLQKWFQKRMRDFHPTKDGVTGGAENFLTSLRDEILPFLQANYRVDVTNRALYGHSSAGLFAFYAGIKQPKLFSRILATSPSLEEEPAWAATFPDMISARGADLPKIYMSVDASEIAMADAVAPHVALLKAQVGAGQFKYEVLNEGSHMSVIPKAYTAGLHFLYAK